MDIILGDLGVESFHSLYIITAVKDVHVLPDLALFVKDSIAESGVKFPQNVESFINR